MASEEVNSLKNEANDYFKNGDYDQAEGLYKKALGICTDNNTKVILHKNAAANYLKLNKNEEALKQCDKVLEISPNDPKALFRRACALENLEKFEEAYRDAQKALVSSPEDQKAFKPLLSRLHVIVEQRRNKFSQTKEKATRMMNIAFGVIENSTEEEIEKAFNNILVLSRERAGIESLLELGLLVKIRNVFESKLSSVKEMERKMTCVRTLTEILSSNTTTCKRVLSDLGLPFIMNLQDIAFKFKGNQTLKDEALGTVQYLWQAVLDTLSGAVKGEKPNEKLLAENKILIDSFMTTLSVSVNSRAIEGVTRDIIIQILIKNIDYTALSWADQFIEIGGMIRVLEVAAEVPELKIESGMELTTNTRNLVSVFLNRLYTNMFYDKLKENYTKVIDDFTKNLLLNPDMDTKIQVVSVFIVLLLGPVDVGNSFIGRQGIMEMILVMANSDNYLQQKIASEAIIAAASKKDKATSIINEGVNILKKLYQSKSDDIKVRALVGLCKLGSSGGHDSTWKPFSEGATMKLAEACRRFLLNPAKDLSIQRWAIEGLSYLTLDAEVKEQLVEDQASMKVLLEMSTHVEKQGEILYPIITSLVNLVNAYDKQEIIPEMIELAKFAKHHIPEEHEFDDPDFVDKRIETLVKLGVAGCLVNLSKATDSANILELISRVLNAICEKDICRGTVVAQGGARELISIFQRTTEKGKTNAANALARIGITQPPSVAFPGQRSAEVVKPLMHLMKVECTALQNFEGLMAMCNLAGESETLRNRIWEDQGYMNIEHYIYEEHPKLRLAGVQCLTNLALSEKVVKLFEGENDRIKYLLLLCSEPEGLSDEDKDEIDLMCAAAGTLAILSTGNRKICGRLLTCSPKVFEILLWLAANPILDIQLRGLAIIGNILECDKEFGEQLIGSNIMEVLMAISSQKMEDPNPEILKKKLNVQKRANEALTYAEKWELIQRN